MALTRRLGWNSLRITLARTGMYAATAAFTILLARFLGSRGFGEYAFMAAVIFLANSLTTFGTDLLLIREIAAHDRLDLLPAALVLQLLLSALVILAIWFLAPLVQALDRRAVTAIRIFSLSLLPLAFFSIFTIALRGKERMGAFSMLGLGAALGQLTGVALFLGRDADLVRLAIILLVAQIAAALLGAALCICLLPGFWKSWRGGRVGFTIFRTSAPLGLLTSLNVLYQKLSLTLLTVLSGANPAGFFSASARMIEMSKTAHVSAFTALYPAIAQSYANPQHLENNRRTFARSLGVLLLGAAALAALLFAFAAPLIQLLFGSAYHSSILVLKILSWILIPFTANNFLMLLFLAGGKEHAVARVLLLSLLALAGLSIWWIHLFGLQGASWAALITEGLQTSLFLNEARQIESIRGLLRTRSALTEERLASGLNEKRGT